MHALKKWEEGIMLIAFNGIINFFKNLLLKRF